MEKITTKDFKFLRAIGKIPLTLKQIGEKEGMKKWECTRIANGLEGLGWIKTWKEGKFRYVKITFNGEFWKRRARSMLK